MSTTERLRPVARPLGPILIMKSLMEYTRPPARLAISGRDRRTAPRINPLFDARKTEDNIDARPRYAPGLRPVTVSPD